MPQCELSPSGMHKYVPTRSTLSMVFCVHCSEFKSCTKSKSASTYTKYRRATMVNQGLRNVNLCLEAESADNLHNILVEAGIKEPGTTASTSEPLCVVLCEGILAGSPQDCKEPAPLIQNPMDLEIRLDAIKDTMKVYPVIKIRKLHKIRRTDRLDLDMLIADVHVVNHEVPAQLRALSWCDYCVLPQYTYHMWLGSVPRDDKKSVTCLKNIRNTLKGKKFKLNPDTLVCKPLMGLYQSRTARLCDTPFRFVPSVVPSMNHHQAPPSRLLYHPISMQRKPLDIFPEFIPSRSYDSKTSTSSVECDQTAYLSESSDSDHDESRISNASGNPSRKLLYTGKHFEPNKLSITGADFKPPERFSTSDSTPNIETGTLMDEADLMCDLTFLDH